HASKAADIRRRPPFGRNPNRRSFFAMSSLRELFVEYSNLTRSDGSALFCNGHTVCQTAVFGPKCLSSLKEHVSRMEIDVLFKRKTSNQNNIENKVVADWMKAAVEQIILTNLHPHSNLSIITQEIENDGCVLATALNSICCALVDAGVPMNGLIAASSVVIDKEDNLIIDSSLKDCSEYKAVLTFAFESNKCEIVSMTTEGKFTHNQFTKCMQMCKSAAKQIFDFYSDSIKQRFVKL
ncbi:exosome complex component RRP46-like protein, partial [Dinothrombium tinctorium]